ncbi:MAG: methyl-accepting chemotaxis protein [Candidatus Omnitrophota bacterium]
MKNHAQVTEANRRTNYFIEKPFQVKFILKFCSLLALGGVITIGIVYFLAMRTTTVAIVNSRIIAQSTAYYILPILTQAVVLTMIVVILMAIALTLFISHRIAGPFYRIKQSLKQLEQGDFSSNCNLRQLDQLKDIAEAFNNMIKKNNSQLRLLKEDYNCLRSGLEPIFERITSPEEKEKIAEIKKILVKFDSAVNYFKI